MGFSFIATGLIVIDQTQDLLIDILVIAGAVAVIWRISILIAYQRQSRNETLSFARARQLEHIFAVPYLLFASIFGGFSARAFVIALPDTHVLTTGLLFGYAAGVAAGTSYRLWISLTAMLLAVLPTVFVALSTPNPIYWAVAGLLVTFLVGGIHSMIGRYRYAAAGIKMSQLFERLARSDALTGLGNRLSLSEKFAAIAAKRTLTAVHCLDLDRFKPVNDRYGHPTGDLLLQAVAQRLAGLLRQGDFVARTGGDEFVVVQSGLSDLDEAGKLAERIRAALGEPFSLEGRSIQIGSSVGYAVSSDQGHDLDRLVACADTALLEAKAFGGGVAAFHQRAVLDFRAAG